MLFVNDTSLKISTDSTLHKYISSHIFYILHVYVPERIKTLKRTFLVKVGW